jgi:hypothetical protein
MNIITHTTINCRQLLGLALSNNSLKVFAAVMLTLGALNCTAQKDRKVSFIGGARSVMTSNRIAVADSIADTTTAMRNTGGYALVDLGVNLKPNKNTEIMGMFRIRNNYGGFWGGGVTFDVRQVYLKGVVANALRYQLGDLNLKQTPFTLYNHHADAIDSLPAIFALQNNIVRYERFYQQNTWRMQGANIDFGLTFRNYLKQLNFTGFITRLNATDFGNVAERLMTGSVVEMVQSNRLRAAYNFNSVFDVKGTSTDSNRLLNKVQSIDLKYETPVGSHRLIAKTEFGNSLHQFTADTMAPALSDYFIHGSVQGISDSLNLSATIGYVNVGPDYRSIGAQSKDVNYNAVPQTFERYTNLQSIRPITVLDVVASDRNYNTSVSSRLQNENALYNHAMPYGLATFNRVGAYAQVDYRNGVDVHVSYYNLSEIRGQGTLALQKFNLVKLNAQLPLHQYLKLPHALVLQSGAWLQTTKRTSALAVENVNLRNIQMTAGFTWEMLKNLNLIGGLITSRVDGNYFSSDRNGYSEVIYYNAKKVQLKQTTSAIGLRYDFTPKIYISSMYQGSKYEDVTNAQTDFTLSQFNIIYNMLF